MAQTLTQLTLAWLIATIEAKRAGLAGSLAQTPVADWGAAPVRDVRNHEQDLHTAMQVLGDMLNVRGAFAASGIPAAPHLERVPAYVCGVDLSAEYVAALKQARADSIQHEWRACIELTPAPALEAPAAPARQPLTKQEIINRFDFLEGVVNEHYYFEIVKVAEGIQAAALAAAPQAPGARLDIPPSAITASLMRDDGGEAPAYCLMVAYRSESDARAALAMLSKAPATPIHLGTPHCAGHGMPLDGSRSTIDADANKGA